MTNLAEYFKDNRYSPKYDFGTRVFGYWNKIPFVGTIYGDSVINDIEGPRLTISLDLPIKFENKVMSILIDKHKNIKNIKLLSKQ